MFPPPNLPNSTRNPQLWKAVFLHPQIMLATGFGISVCDVLALTKLCYEIYHFYWNPHNKAAADEKYIAFGKEVEQLASTLQDLKQSLIESYASPCLEYLSYFTESPTHSCPSSPGLSPGTPSSWLPLLPFGIG